MDVKSKKAFSKLSWRHNKAGVEIADLDFLSKDIQKELAGWFIAPIASDEVFVGKVDCSGGSYVGCPEHCEDCKAFWEKFPLTSAFLMAD